MEFAVVLGILVVLVILVGVYVWSRFRRLAVLGDRVDRSWEAMSGQRAHRAELLPPLVTEVREYAAHEKAVFEQVERSREDVLSAQDPAAAAAAESGAQRALTALFAVAQGYPQLQASPSFQERKAEVASSEKVIQSARRDYNGAVREWNSALTRFPTALFARGDRFAQRAFFETADSSSVAEPPRVQF